MEMNNVTNINKVTKCFRGEVYYMDFGVGIGSEQSGIRPVIIAQNDVGNTYSPTSIGFAITSQITKAKLPTHIEASSECGLDKPSVILCEQIRTFDKKRLKQRIGKAPRHIIDAMNKAICISLAVGEGEYNFMSREEKFAYNKAQLVYRADNTLRELIQENESLKLIDKYTNKRMDRINELEAYCKQNKLDYKRFYNMPVDTRVKQYN